MSAFDSAISLPTVSTGTSLVVGSQKLTDNQQQATPMSPMDSLKELFVDMRYALESIAINTFETNELLRGTPQQQRDTDIREGETDVPPPVEEKGPGVLASLGNTLSNLNPFKDGMSPIMKFLLAGAALIGLRVFGEKLNEPLANLVKMFKEGTIVDNIKETVENIKERLEPIIEDIKDNIEKFIIGVTKVKDLIVNAYNFVNDYIMQFDTDNSGTLDELEQDALKEDLKDKTVNLIGDFISGIWDAVRVSILGTVFLGAGVKAALASPAIASIFGKKGVTAAAAAGAKFIGPTAPAAAAGIGAAGAFGIAALLAYGITTTYANYQKSMLKTLEETGGDFEMGTFVANFLGGKNDGGVMNAFTKAFEVGGTGALAGMAIGAIGGPPGILIGGLLGMATGGLLGAITGYLGSDKLKEMGANFKKSISDTVDTINSFFDDILDNIKGYFTGSTTKYETDEKAISEDLEEAEKNLAQAKADKAALPSTTPKHKIKSADADILAAQKEVDELKILLENVPEAIEKRKIEEQTSATKQMDSRLKNLRKSRDSHVESLQRAIDNNNEKGQQYFRKAIKQRNDMILEVENEKKQLLKSEFDVDYTIPKIKMDPIVSRFDDPSFKVGPGHPSNFMFAPNNAKINSDNVQKQETHAYTGGLTGDNPHFTALMMAHKKAKMAT